MLGRTSRGSGFGYGHDCGYGDSDGFGSGSRYGSGSGSGSGFGFGYGSGSGSGSGFGFGYGDGFGFGSGSRSGYGDGFGSGETLGITVADYECAVIPPWAILKIGCEVHSLDHWREHWQSIADRNAVEVDEEEIMAIIAAAEAVLGG